MARGRELTCTCYMILEDGSTIELEKLTPEQRETWLANVRRRLSVTMSAYYTQHPDEYLLLEG